LVRNRHKALVFSQFVGQLERVGDALRALHGRPAVHNQSTYINPV